MNSRVSPVEGFKSAARPELDYGLQYHLRVKLGYVSRYVPLPGAETFIRVR